jgi:alanine racemase
MLSAHFPHPSWIEIDLSQLKKNISVVRSHIGEALYCLPVKANAYGHGLKAVAKAAAEAGVDYIAVAHLSEGILLREANIRIPILVLGAIHADQIVDLMNFNLEFTISSEFKANLVAEQCKKRRQKCLVHLEVDTGMQRTGVRSESALKLFNHVKNLECFEIKGIYSHLATADQPEDPFALKQIELFSTLLSNPVFEGTSLIRHMANSGGTAFFKQAHFDMVRPTLMTLGYAPTLAPENLNAIKPCLSVKTKVSYFKVVEEGIGISYGHSHVTHKKTRIVTVPIGYGDGYRRSLSNKGSVLIRGKRFPIVGTICMDQLMVDVGDQEVRVGDEVVLIGKQAEEEITLQEVAQLCDTNTYEILCAFNDRLPRRYF